MKHTDAIIPDGELEGYLKFKLTEKPDYGYSTEKESAIVSDWLKRMADEAKIRKTNNTSAGRGLKR
jgi:hypothetical protein